MKLSRTLARPALACSTALLLTYGLAPGSAAALGLGEITLNSALNEPLDAEIEITSATQVELINLTAAVAPRETFERYGLDRPDFLSGLRFRVEQVGDRTVLRARSVRPIPEPFVTFLVQADWKRGSLLREYTVLLDPPVFAEAPSSAPPVVTPRSETTTADSRSGSVERAPAPAPAQAAPAPRASRTRPLIPAAGASGEYGPVQRGETLWEIAEQARPDTGIGINEMMIAIFRANPEAFLGNINLLREGSTLRIPDRSAIVGIGSGEANAQVQQHNSAWRDEPQATASAAPAAPVAAAEPEPAPARLRLVPPEESGQGRSGGGADAVALAQAQERLVAQAEELERLADENADMRSELDEIRRLITLRDEQLAQLQQQLAGAGAVPAQPAPLPGTEPAPAAESLADAAPQTGAPAAESPQTPAPAQALPEAGTQPAADAAEPEAAPEPAQAAEAPPAPQPGLVERVTRTVGDILGSIWLWLGLGVAAVAAFGLFLMRSRLGAGDADALDELTREAEEDTGETRVLPKLEEAAEAPGEVFEETGTFKPVDFATQALSEPSGDTEALPAADLADSGLETAEYPFEDTMGTEGAIKLDQSDPLAEADFHLAYGLYDQAADLVRKAVAREPDRRDLQLKLLEIFFVWGNRDEFLNSARTLRASMGDRPDAEWDKIVIMGKQICPDDELFSGESAVATHGGIDLDLEASGTAETALDLSTGEDTGSGVDLDFGEALGGDAGGEEKARHADSFGESLDFDIGAQSTMVPALDSGQFDPNARTGESELPGAAPGPDFDGAPTDQVATEFGLADTEELTAPESLEAIQQRLESELAESGEETAGMDLSELGVDLDAADLDAAAMAEDAESGATTATDLDTFDDFFTEGTGMGDQTSEMPTSEMPAAEQRLAADAEALAEADEAARTDADLAGDFDDVFADLAADIDETTEMPTAELPGPADVDVDIGAFADEESADATASDLDRVDEQMERTARITPVNRGEETEFSAEVRTLTGEPVDLDLADLSSEALGEEPTMLASALPGAEDSAPAADTRGADGADGADDGDTRVLGRAETGQPAGDETRVIGRADTGAGDDFSEIFSGSDDETVQLGAMDEETGEHFAADFGGSAEPGLDLDVGDAAEGEQRPTLRVATAELALPETEDELSEVGTKLDLARAYMDMGDPDGARGILEEVLEEGDESQQGQARDLLAALS